MGNSSRRDARRVDVKKWRTKALELRVEGLTIRAIAARLKKSVGAVHEAIELEITAIPMSAVAELRQVEGDRLDALIAGHIRKARRGDAEAAHVVIAAIRQRSKLFGLDAPTRNEHTGKDGGPIASFDMSKLSDDKIDRLIAGDLSVLQDGDAPSDPGASEG